MLPYAYNEAKPSPLDWLQNIMVLLFLIVAPFYIAIFNGYEIYYEHSIYFSVLWSSILLLIVSIRLLKSWQLGGSRDWLSILIWLIPLTYAISMSNAASAHLSLNMLYLNIMYAAFFVFGAYYAVGRFGSALLQNGITIVGYIIVLFGFANFFGNIYYRDAVMLDQGIRITSVFQYANSYAAFVIAILLVCICLLVAARKRSYILLHGFMLVPLVLSLLLTLSRGGIVVLPVIFLLVLPFIPMVRQLLAIIYLAIAGLMALAISGLITDWGIEIANKVLPTATPDWNADTLSPFDSLSLYSWSLLLGASIATALIVYAIHTWVAPWLETKLERFSKIKFSSVALPAILIILGGLGIFLLFGNTGFTKILPDTLRTRIENINFNQHSVLERFTFYKDSIKLVKEYPVFGAGGGGWAVLYEKYQNNPYTSRQAHSFFMQSLVETGIVGFAVLLLLLAAIFYIYVRNYIRSSPDERGRHLVFYIVAVSLLVHSIIDFDISYGFLAALIFLCMGGMMASVRTHTAAVQQKMNAKVTRYMYPTFTGITALVICGMMFFHLKVNGDYREAATRVASGEAIQTAIQPLDAALKAQPHHPDLNLRKIDWYISAYEQTQDTQFSDEIMRIIDTMKSYEQNNRFFIERDIYISLQLDQKERALAAATEGIEKLPWDITMYDQAISLLFDLGEQARLANDKDQQSKRWDKVLALYDTVGRKTEELKLLPEGQMQGRPFSVTPNMSLVVGEIYFIRGDYAKASEVLKPSLSTAFDQEINKNIAKWYLAAITKLGQADPTLQDQLIQADPQQKKDLEALVNFDFNAVP